MQFKNKVVVITGASSGIGRALAYEFASHGARIVMGARSGEKLQQIAADLKSRNTEVAYAPTDVTQEADCQRLIETAVTRFGGVDILICNAGISMRALFDEVDLNVLRRLMDVNFWGTVYCTKYTLHPAEPGVDRRRFIGSRHTRTARTYGILSLEVRDDRISGDRPDRKPQKGRTRDDRLSGLHGLECSVLGLDG